VPDANRTEEEWWLAGHVYSAEANPRRSARSSSGWRGTSATRRELARRVDESIFGSVLLNTASSWSHRRDYPEHVRL